MVRRSYIPERADIVWLDFSPQTGKEQRGRRPALVLSSKRYNRFGLCIVCPITSKVKGYPFEIPLDAPPIRGAVLADHVHNMDWNSRSISFIVRAPEECLEWVQRGVAAVISD